MLEPARFVHQKRTIKQVTLVVQNASEWERIDTRVPALYDLRKHCLSESDAEGREDAFSRFRPPK